MANVSSTPSSSVSKSVWSRIYSQVEDNLSDAYGHYWHGDEAGECHSRIVYVVHPSENLSNRIDNHSDDSNHTHFDLGMQFVSVNSRAHVFDVDPKSEAFKSGIRSRDVLQFALILKDTSWENRSERQVSDHCLQLEKNGGLRTSYFQLKSLFDGHCSYHSSSIFLDDTIEGNDKTSGSKLKMIFNSTSNLINCPGAMTNNINHHESPVKDFGENENSTKKGKLLYPVALVFRRTNKRNFESHSKIGLSFRLDEELDRASYMVQCLMSDAEKDNVEASTIRSMIQNAVGLAFIRTTKLGVLGVMAVQGGSGIVISRLPDGTWSAPSAIGTYGVGLGIQFGLKVVDYIYILQAPEAMAHFSSGKKFTTGGSIATSFNTLKNEAYGATDDKLGQTVPIAAYAQSQGLYFGVSLEGSTIYTRNDINSKTYKFTKNNFHAPTINDKNSGNVDITAHDILNGNISSPPEAEKLYTSLHSLESAHKKSILPKIPDVSITKQGGHPVMNQVTQAVSQGQVDVRKSTVINNKANDDRIIFKNDKLHLPEETSSKTSSLSCSTISSNTSSNTSSKYSQDKLFLDEIVKSTTIPLPLALCRVLILDSSSPVIQQWEFDRGDKNVKRTQWYFPPGTNRVVETHQTTESQLISSSSMIGAIRTKTFNKKRSGDIKHLIETYTVEADDKEQLVCNISEQSQRNGFYIKVRLSLRASGTGCCQASVLAELKLSGDNVSNQTAIHKAFRLTVHELKSRYGIQKRGLVGKLLNIVNEIMHRSKVSRDNNTLSSHSNRSKTSPQIGDNSPSIVHNQDVKHVSVQEPKKQLTPVTNVSNSKRSFRARKNMSLLSPKKPKVLPNFKNTVPKTNEKKTIPSIPLLAKIYKSKKNTRDSPSSLVTGKDDNSKNVKLNSSAFNSIDENENNLEKEFNKIKSRTPNKAGTSPKGSLLERPSTPTFRNKIVNETMPRSQKTLNILKSNKNFDEELIRNGNGDSNQPRPQKRRIEVKPLPKIRLDLMPAPREEDEDNYSSSSPASEVEKSRRSKPKTKTEKKANHRFGRLSYS